MRPGSLRSPVVSYTAVSPLPAVRRQPAVCSLLRFPSRGVTPATSFLKKDFLPCGVRTFLFAKQSGRRCSSRIYYITRTGKIQIIFAFFGGEDAGMAVPMMYGVHYEVIFGLFLFRGLQSVLPCDTLFAGLHEKLD